MLGFGAVSHTLLIRVVQIESFGFITDPVDTFARFFNILPSIKGKTGHFLGRFELASFIN